MRARHEWCCCLLPFTSCCADIVAFQEMKQRELTMRSRVIRNRMNELQADGELGDKEAKAIAEDELASGKLQVRTWGACHHVPSRLRR